MYTLILYIIYPYSNILSVLILVLALLVSYLIRIRSVI